jgi:hypothetical protein
MGFQILGGGGWGSPIVALRVKDLQIAVDVYTHQSIFTGSVKRLSQATPCPGGLLLGAPDTESYVKRLLSPLSFFSLQSRILNYRCGASSQIIREELHTQKKKPAYMVPVTFFWLSGGDALMPAIRTRYLLPAMRKPGGGVGTYRRKITCRVSETRCRGAVASLSWRELPGDRKTPMGFC